MHTTTSSTESSPPEAQQSTDVISPSHNGHQQIAPNLLHDANSSAVNGPISQVHSPFMLDKQSSHPTCQERLTLDNHTRCNIPQQTNNPTDHTVTSPISASDSPQSGQLHAAITDHTYYKRRRQSENFTEPDRSHAYPPSVTRKRRATIPPNTTVDDPLFLSKHNKDYEKAIRIGIVSSCTSCFRFLFPEQIFLLITFTARSNDLGVTRQSDLCGTCKRALAANQIPSCCARLNHLEVSRPPPDLLALNPLELRLLAKTQVFMTFYILPGGQYARKGLVLNIPVKTDFLNNQLPTLTNSNVCAVRFNPTGTHSEHLPLTHYVRPPLLNAAFTWLRTNNHLYTDDDFFTCDKDRRPPATNDDQMPDEQISSLDDSTSSDPTLPTLDCLLSMEQASLIPVNYPAENRLRNLQTPTLDVPRSAHKPIDVYSLEYGEGSAFPHLFPHGCFGFKYKRPVRISASMYFKTRIYSHMPDFRKDIKYMLHAAASYDKLQLKGAIGIYLRIFQHGDNTTPVNAGYIQDSPTLFRFHKKLLRVYEEHQRHNSIL